LLLPLGRREDFAELFDADAIEAAVNALIEEIINFSPAAKRKALTRFYQTAQRIAAAQEKELEKILNDEKVDEKIEEEMKKSYTGSQASSASIQIPLHSGS
jgi:anaerobic ribonucleoside-triphosphate reductase